MTEHARNDVPSTSAFLEILCADPDLLRMEFDSIIAASFPNGERDGDQEQRPPLHPNDLLVLKLPPAQVPAGTRAALLTLSPVQHGTAVLRARERSPPRRSPSSRRTAESLPPL
ncbi:hypothetical protein [Pseudonocardia sp. GCM10023141]|uniref:hypothetical protein n=1 Tax=Pseudonocardia sp. GCM10023141 TaxID=3252653 RepID=UPI003612A75D